MASPTVSDATFATDVLQSDLPVLVDFWAEWCGPCRSVGPIIDEIGAENADKLKVYKLNVDENPQTAMAYRVMSIPSMIVFNGGKEVKRLVGARPKSMIMADLADFV